MDTSRSLPGARACRLFTAALAALLFCSCGGGDGAGSTCSKSSQCPSGQGCDATGHCAALPCGGCLENQVCLDSGACAAAQGARCPSAGCPTGYDCKGGLCSLHCTLDRDCADPTLVCNAGTCAQCAFDADCAKVTGKPRCNGASGLCVQCSTALDCGAGKFCDATSRSCQTGCRQNGDCNLSAGERCDGATATAPGRCVQCTSDTDCAATPSAPACDPTTGRCVTCTADKYCNQSTPRCDPVTEACYQCLPANDASGSDCGYSPSAGAPKDPHNASVCDPASRSCTAGCKTDAQCGCPLDPTGQPTSCARRYKAERCDPALTSMPLLTGVTTEGGCVECTQNSQCKCKVQGSTGATAGCDAGWPQLGALNGARCVKDSSTGYGACQEGCDTDADCPTGKACGAAGTANAHKCVECTCDAANATADGTWCSDPVGTHALGGCAAGKVCDASSRTCRLKRYAEACSASSECGDPHDPTIGLCIEAPAICVLSSHPYGSATTYYCDPGKATGRCGIPCNDLQSNSCVAGAACPAGSCRTAKATEGSSGQYCVSSNCSTQ
jgi:hypothetical protein